MNFIFGSSFLRMVSAVDVAKRAFIKVLLQLAVTYGIKLSLNRDSTADAVTAAFRKAAHL